MTLTDPNDHPQHSTSFHWQLLTMTGGQQLKAGTTNFLLVVDELVEADSGPIDDERLLHGQQLKDDSLDRDSLPGEQGMIGGGQFRAIAVAHSRVTKNALVCSGRQSHVDLLFSPQLPIIL